MGVAVAGDPELLEGAWDRSAPLPLGRGLELGPDDGAQYISPRTTAQIASVATAVVTSRCCRARAMSDCTAPIDAIRLATVRIRATSECSTLRIRSEADNEGRGSAAVADAGVAGALGAGVAGASSCGSGVSGLFAALGVSGVSLTASPPWD
jgi:hypothetical protein